MRSERVTVAPGVALAVNVWDGEGEPFVLVHGLASNARLWDGVARALSAEGHHVVAVDQRGHGQSDKPDGGYDFTTITNDLRHLIDELGMVRPIVVGQSWGGNVVIELAWRFPELVRGVAAIDGGVIDLRERFTTWEECEQRLRPPKLIGMPFTRIEGAIRAAHPDWPAEGIAGTLANFEVLPDGTIRPWLTLERHLMILRAMWEHSPVKRFPEVKTPVLFMPADSGDVAWTHDKNIAIDAALAALPNGRVHWFAPAEHDVHAQKPLEVASVLLGALDDGFFA